MSARNNRGIYSLYLREKSYLRKKNFAEDFLWDDVLLSVGYLSPFYHGKISFHRRSEESVNF
jgi:hypothetical protein